MVLIHRLLLLSTFIVAGAAGVATQNFPTGIMHVICDSGCAAGAPGQQVMAASSPVVIASNQSAIDVHCTVGCSAGTPGQTTMADSSPVVIASDQSAVPVSGTFWQATQPVSIASMPSTPVTGTFWQATQPVSGTITANQGGTWTVQPGNTANTTAWKVDGSAVTQPVSGTFWQATQPVSGTVTTTPPANASTNVAQLAGTTTSVNSGTKDAGTLRVVLATDQPALTNKLLVTPDSVALPANQSVNVAQVAGTNTVNGGLAGSLSIGGTAGNNAAITQNPLVGGLEARSSTPTAATNGNQIRQAGDLAGNTFNVMPIGWTCNLQALAATLTQCQAAPSAGYSLYLTSIIATTTTTTAGTFAIRYGTGTNCATSPIGVWPQPGGAAPSRVTTAPISTAAPMVINLGPVGFKIAAANAVCVIGVATNTIDISLSGYTAP